jgi:hypothetical protein
VKLLKLCLREVILSDDVELSDLATKLDGYSGSDICNLCRYKFSNLLKFVFVKYNYTYLKILISVLVFAKSTMPLLVFGA